MPVSRRRFVTTASAAGAGLLILPRHVLGRGYQAPSDLVNFATCGIGGMGRVNTRNAAGHNFVAVCDVDAGLMNGSLTGYARDIERERASRAEAAAKGETERVARLDGVIRNLERLNTHAMPRLQRYADYRVMLEKQKDIDAVIIATPDHMHAPIAMAAMQAGKHVYLQKPLCWSVSEARQLAKAAADNPRLVTQMGNQGHSADDARRSVEYIRAGAIGEVRDVHVWTNRPLAYWPQGLPRPTGPQPIDASRPARWNGAAIDRRLAEAMGTYVVPEGLDWNLFLGVAPDVPYHPVYHPFNWRGWVDERLEGLGPVAVWPSGPYNPVSEENRAAYFESLFYSAAVVGINTSAMVEAAILGKPVLSFVPDEFRGTQEGTLHFRYLLASNGGPVTMARTEEEHHAQLTDVLRRPDEYAARARAFVSWFIRPHGLDRPATPALVAAIEDLAARGHGPRREASASALPLRAAILGVSLGTGAIAKAADPKWRGRLRKRASKGLEHARKRLRARFQTRRSAKAGERTR